MHYYYSDPSFAAGLGALGLVVGIVGFALVVAVVIAYFMAISSLVKTARAKNCPFGSGKLWFIGLFTTPVILGILVAAQPDRSGHIPGAGQGHFAS